MAFADAWQDSIKRWIAVRGIFLRLGRTRAEQG
jgi:hypothetical protein